jgi:ATP-binding cassette subfamily C protein
MTKNQRKTLWKGFKDFYLFSPKKQIIIFILMLFQGITSGIGLLFIIPLLQIIGIDLGSTNTTSASAFANQTFIALGFEASLKNILCFYILVVSLIAFFRFQLNIISTEIQQSYISHLRETLYKQLLHCHWQFILERKMSDFTHCLSNQVQAIGQASQLMLTLMSQIVLSLVMIVIALFVSWQMTLLAVFFGSILLTILLPFNQLIHNSGRKQLINAKQIFQILTEQLSSLKMIKSYGCENDYAEQIKGVSRSLESQQLEYTRMSSITQEIYTIGSVIAASIFFYIAQHVFSTPLPTILLLLVILSRLLPRLSLLQKTYQQLLHKTPSFTDISEMNVSCKQAQEPTVHLSSCPILQRKISLQNVSYCYPNKQQLAFEPVSFEITKNQTVALVGPSGAGKTTLADLIAGLLEPTKGLIYCDNTLLDKEHRTAWRHKVAYVTQEVYLFHDTIRANLSWVTQKSITDDDIWYVLNQAAAANFVRRLPQGIDTVIGDRGTKLSGGERQRLALARALLAEPQLLILDEATSSLDQENEQAIQRALKQLQGTLTIIIIAHSETTIAHSDQRITLTNSGA